MDYRIASGRSRQKDGAHSGRRSGWTPRAIRPRGARQIGSALTPAAPTAAHAPDTGAADTTIPSGNVPPPLPSTGSDAATVASDEICRGDQDRLQRLSDSPTSDGVIRLLIELRCEKLRPQLLSVAKRLEDKVPAPPADAAQDASSSVLPGPVASTPPLPPPRLRTNEPSKRLRSTSRAALSRNAMRLGGQPRTCRSSFWPSSAGASTGFDGPKPPAAQAAALGRAELGFRQQRSAAGTIDPNLRFSPAAAKEAEGRHQSTTGFWPPSMDRVTPVM